MKGRSIMDPIMAARELGKAIQADERYAAYIEAKEANDKDEELQKLIDDFDRKRSVMQIEMQKDEDEQNPEELQKLNREMQESYAAVMKNVNMASFVIAKGAMDKLMENVYGIIGLCIDGHDPDTCEPSAACTGSCSTCGGCG